MPHFFNLRRLLPLGLAGTLITSALLIITIPAAYAVAICEDSIRDFPGGPGRRPGATPIPVFIRQTVMNEEGVYVFATIEAQLADVAGDAINFKVDVKNNSSFDVGFVELQHSYRTVREGPKLVSISNVVGGSYVPSDHMFVIDRIPAGSTVSLTYTLYLSRMADVSVMQSSVLLHDFMVLDPQSRFPQRYPETAIGRHRTTIEKVGIGGKEVACFTGENADRYALPGQKDTVTPAQSAFRTPSVQSPPSSIVLTPEQIRGKLTISLRADPSSSNPGDTVRYFVSVQNATSGTFYDMLVDSRFDTNLLDILDANGGVATQAGIQWLIDTLNPGQTWNTSYDVRVDDGIVPGRSVPTTVSLFSGDLLDVPSSALTMSKELRVVSGDSFVQSRSQETPYTVRMPQTGVAFWSVVFIMVQAFLGVAIASLLYIAAAWMLWRRMV
ncbi:MAG TPA: hypothetical protein VJB82_01190 [Candidatus Peribacterales bacterium]|nr:hypothetical protein [Candidatus Peribacterales bacterium]